MVGGPYGILNLEGTNESTLTVHVIDNELLIGDIVFVFNPPDNVDKPVTDKELPVAAPPILRPFAVIVPPTETSSDTDNPP